MRSNVKTLFNLCVQADKGLLRCFAKHMSNSKWQTIDRETQLLTQRPEHPVIQHYKVNEELFPYLGVYIYVYMLTTLR